MSDHLTNTNRTKFKTSVKSFMDWLDNHFQDSSDITAMTTGVRMSCVNIGFVVDSFMKSIGSHADEIMKSNDNYFLKLSEEDFNIESKSTDNQLSVLIKELWGELSEAYKAYVRKSFKLLLIKGALAARDIDVITTINKYTKTPYVDGKHF